MIQGNHASAAKNEHAERPGLVGLEDWLFQKESDEDLMLACRKGESQALEHLYRRYYKQLYAYVSRFLYDSDRAEDVVQEVFFRVYRNRERYQPTAKFSSWVYRIARNLCVDEKRRHWSKRVILDSQITDDEGNSNFLDYVSDDKTNARDKYYENADMKSIREAIESLSEEQREVMVLHKYQGLSYKEIADILEITPESVKQRAYRAHMRLRQLLKPLMEEAQG